VARTTSLFALVFGFLLGGCTNPSKDQIAQYIKDNPAALAGAIKSNPDAFKDALQAAQTQLREQYAREQAEKEQKETAERMADPLKPNLSAAQVFKGSADAKIVIVEYTDFQCPYCSRGADSMKEVLKRFDGKVKVTVKHLPLDFHKHALPAAKYYEAIRMQKPKAALDFHDAVFANQAELNSGGEKFLEAEAKKLGINIPKLKKDLESKAVTEKIDADMAEAKEFGFRGTPSFLVGGVPVRGALPPDEFAKIIEQLLAKKG
jgi:protein-disulfide isomerase